MLDDEVVNGRPIHEWARTMLIEWRLKEKVGADVIAKRLTEARVLTPSGRRAWSDSTVSYLLKQESLLQYAGYGIWNKMDYRSGGKRYRDRSDVTKSLAEGVSPGLVRSAINDRTAHLERLDKLGNVPLPRKITDRDLATQAAEICAIAESRDPGAKHWSVAPGGVEPMATFEIRFTGRRGHHFIRSAD